MLCQFLTVGLLGTELLGNGESRHDRTAVDGVEFYFVGYLERITQSFGDIGEDGVHLGGCLHPFLLGVAHTLGVVQVFAGTKADQAVVGLSVVGIDEMDVVGGD